MTGGAQSALVVDTPPATSFKSKSLTLATGAEKLRLGGGVVIAVDGATVGGQSLATGVYEANGVFGTKVDWIEGSGFLCVGGAAAPVIPTESAETVEKSWTANGGNDTTIGNGSNWGVPGATDVPDFASGSLVATFGTGTGATLDRNATFKGINVTTPGAFAFPSVDGANNWAFLGAGGLTTGGSGCTYSWNWPLYLIGAQRWWIASGDTLDVTSQILDNGRGRLSLDGGGTLNLRAKSAFSGPMTITNTVVHAYADNALGAGSGIVDIDFKTSKLHLHGVTLDRSIRNSRKGTNQANDGSRGELVIAAGTTNVINGDFDLASTQMEPTFGVGSVLRIKGHLKRGTTSWLYLGDNGTVILDKPVVIETSSALGMKANKTIYFNAPDNNLGLVWFWLQGDNGKIFTTVPFAFSHNRKTYVRSTSAIKNFVWDLCGCDQGVTLWGMHKDSTSTITSEKPATLFLKHDVVSYDGGSAYEATNKTCFAGAANVNFVGSKFFQFAGPSTSTGTVQVTTGRLEFGADGSWTNATAAIVAGGEMKFFNRRGLGRGTDVRFTGTSGTMNLAYSGSMAVHDLWFGDEQQQKGTYGSASSTAQHKDARFAGTGVLAVIGEGYGTVLFFR